MPDGDYEAEGFAWLDENGVHPLLLGDPWRVFRGGDTCRDWRDYAAIARQSAREMWVVRFELVLVVTA